MFLHILVRKKKIVYWMPYHSRIPETYIWEYNELVKSKRYTNEDQNILQENVVNIKKR